MASGVKKDSNEANFAASVMSHPAEEFENNPDVEMMWVIKATEHMEVYFNLLTSVDPRLLRLTPHDDKIYEEFRKDFPQLDVNILNEKELKSIEAKEKWRPFCNKFEKVVEDFNFGTIIRLDSSGEYTNENSIFVPRIQFYAIEIARNREGHNDSIRKTFGCRRKKATNKSCNDAESQCMTSRFELTMQEFMDRFCLQHKLSPVKLCKLLRKDDGSLKRGDYLLLCGNPDACYLNTYLKEIGEVLPCYSNSWCLPVAQCKVLPTHHLQLFLDRNIGFRNVLAAINNKKKNYGMCQTRKSKQLIIHYTFHHISRQKSSNTLTYLRTKLIAQHIGAMLSRNGYIVYSSQHDEKREEGLSNDDKHFHLKETKLKEIEKNLKESAYQYIHEFDKETQEKHEKETDKEVAFDALKFLLDHNLPIGSKGYNQNIGYIYINSISWRDICQQIAQLRHIMQEDKLQDPNIVIHISPHNKAYLQHQMGICLQALYNKCPKHQMFFTHEPVIWKDPEHNAVAAEYIRQVQQELEKSLVLKYGKEIIGLPWQKEYLKVLSDTVVKFDLLLPSPSIPVKLSHPTIDIPVNRSGTFVQYNCARLAVLFQKHENLVSTGCYPHLPDIENVDFSLLILEEEWNLLYNYLLVFPQLISSIIEEMKQDNIKLQVPTHKICRFLVNLSHDLSAYYSRVHILIEPRSHLLPTIAARLWLMKGVQQIMHNALDLLAISPLQKM